MKMMIVSLVLFVTLSNSAGAVTDASAYSISGLSGVDSDHGFVRTIVNNMVSSPDLKFHSEGKLDTELKMDKIGSYLMTQGIISGANNYKGLSGRGTFLNSFSGTQVKSVDLKFSGTTNFGFSGANNPYFLESKTFGLAIAAPGTKDYAFTLLGSQKTVTNAIPVSAPLWMTEEPKTYSVSLELNNAMKQVATQELPVDMMKQDITFDYQILENSLVYYGYDFSRELQVGDVGFNAEMVFDHIGEV